MDIAWIMGRGIPTEEVIEKMKDSDPPVNYLVGTPKGRLSILENKFLDLSWEEVRDGVNVKLLDEDGEIYVLVESADRVNKERSMRCRKLRKLLLRLKQLQEQKNSRDLLLLKIGAAKKDAGRAASFIEIHVPAPQEYEKDKMFTYSLQRDKLRIARRKEGRYLLRTNLTGTDPATLWKQYIQLTEVEQAFKDLKGELSLRPVYHRKDSRIEAHIFVAFQAYCLNVTLKQRLKGLSPGLTQREVIEEFKKIQMVDVDLPTTDGRHLIFSRYSQPELEHKILLSQLKMHLPTQPPPRITSKKPFRENLIPKENRICSEDF